MHMETRVEPKLFEDVGPIASGAGPEVGSQTDMRAVRDGSGVGQIVRVDPSICVPCSFNPRAGTAFDVGANHDLVESIRARGQQVPAIVRRGTDPNRLELVAGTRRHGAAMYLRTADPTFTLLVEIRDLSDVDAWRVAEVENAARMDLTDLQRARNWASALTTFFDGNQRELARSLGRDASVVSRMLMLANLPPVLLSVMRNPDRANAYFAETMAPALNDPARREIVLATATEFAARGIALAPAELARRLLLTPAEAEAFRPIAIAAGGVEKQAVWSRKPNGSCALTIRPIPAGMSAADRNALIQDLTVRIKAHVKFSAPPD
ncbi:ParB/RepB/Spo0J family partition protein [uncultured Sphingomonas sp.]|uniref:ParB/RepB/Spo0J family partition protein n=1 Tax=uncultured Sphingomonas sp. TaxID=158754 RepID=UPI0026159C20|nr:ParB/RepB/Spo0J family partition protein [uncultured Sphingomonas sp.]